MIYIPCPDNAGIKHVYINVHQEGIYNFNYFLHGPCKILFLQFQNEPVDTLRTKCE